VEKGKTTSKNQLSNGSKRGNRKEDPSSKKLPSIKGCKVREGEGGNHLISHKRGLEAVSFNKGRAFSETKRGGWRVGEKEREENVKKNKEEVPKLPSATIMSGSRHGGDSAEKKG